MANETNIERGKALLKTLAEGQEVERAVVASDGTVTISHSEATLQAVDVADVDLLLTFSDGSFVIIPNGALDAISNTPHAVIFNDNSDNLSSLFKMVGISNPAKAGSLRVVSENIDAARPPVEESAIPSDEAPPEAWTAPAPMAKVSTGIALTGKGPGLGGSGSGEGEGEVPATVAPVATPTPPAYRNGIKADSTHAPFEYGPDGPPTVSTALYTSSQFKLVASAGSITTEATLPAGSYDPSLASNPTALADRAAPANQAHAEKINGTAGNDVISHNSDFSAAASTWTKTIHLNFNNYAVVEGLSFTLIADSPDKVAGISLAGENVTKNADYSNVWTVDIANYITQHPNYKTDGIDIKIQYPVGSQITPVDFFLEVAVDGTAQSATGAVGKVDTVYTDMFMSLRDAVSVDDFTQTNINDGQLLTLPDGKGTPAGEHQLLILPSGGVGYEINAGAGDDTVHAGAGNDTLIGGTGADILDGGSDLHSGKGATLAGGDTASYITADASVVASLTTTFGHGQPVIQAGDAAGDSFNGIENLTGSNHGDTLIGDGNNNILTGGSGDDILEGMGGTGDLLIGGGHGINGDTASYAHGGPTVSGGSDGVTASLTDVTTLHGTTTPIVNGDATGDAYVNIQNLLGSDYNDTLIGDSNNNILTGGAGNDTLEGLGGADTLVGGDGNNDTVSYDHATAPVVSSLTLSADFTQGPTVTQTGDAEGDTYSGIENMFGSIYGDTLIGDGHNNVINGSAGDDLLEGMGGADTLIGGVGADINNTATYAHAPGAVHASMTPGLSGFYSTGDAAGDTYDHIANLTGSNFNDQLIGDINANVITGGTGNDTLEGMGGADVLIGGVDKTDINNPADNNNTASYEHWANIYGVGITASLTASLPHPIGNSGDAEGDTYYNIQNLTGSSLSDTLIGDAQDNILTGSGGNDRLEGMGGADTLDGGDGNDTASYSQAQTDITASLTDVTTLNKSYTSTLAISGDAIGDKYVSIENLLGSDSNDTLVGDFHSNILTGGLGDDTLEGLGGVDVLNGGDGVDTVSYDHATASVISSLTTGFSHGAPVTQTGDAGDATGASAGDTYSSIENMVGSHYSDTLIGDGGDNAIYGGAGDDKLEGMGGLHDTLYGGTGLNTASYAHAGAVSGSDGVTASLLTPLDSTGNTGDAVGDIYYDIGNLEGSDFNDHLQGDDNANTLIGMGGDDTLEGLGGADVLIGNDQPNDSSYDLNNTASYAHAKETATGSGVGVTASLDSAYQNSGVDAEGDTYHNILNLLGSAYNDTLIGDSHNNRLDGGAGSDLLIGGGGSDQLVGGDSASELSSGLDSTQTGSGATLLGGDTASYETARAGEGVVASLTTKFGYGATVYQLGDASGDSFVGIENLTGSTNNDTLIGNDGLNILNGGLGNDILEGMGGADRIIGGGGNDTASYAHAGSSDHTTGVTASLTPADSNFHVTFASGPQLTVSGDAKGDFYDGIQNLLGSDYNDILIGDGGDNILMGGKGNDTLEGLGGNDRFFGGDGSFSGDDGNDTVSFAHSTGPSGVAASLDDMLNGTAKYNSIENLEGSAFNDTLTGNNLVNTLWGGAGNDVLEGKGGADALYGGYESDGSTGSNTASYASSNFGIAASLSNPSDNTGDAGGDTYFNIQNLTGSAHNDTLVGDDHANILSGGIGDDLLEGKGGGDVLDGGVTTSHDPGSDTASYAHATAVVTTGGIVTTAGVTASLMNSADNSGADAIGDSYISIENLIGSSHDDTLIGDGKFFDGLRVVNILTGGDGNDTLEGMAGADVLIGGNGAHDVASYAHAGLSASGSDTFDGGHGLGVVASLTTQLQFTSGPQVVSLGDAAGDTYSGIEDMVGSSFADTLIGDSGINTINGGLGDDKLEGMGGADVVIGGGGNDTASYAHAGAVSGATGVTVSLTDGSINTGDAIGDTYHDISNIEGSYFNDTLQGDGGANSLTGLAGDDILEGMAGADALDGGDGSNTASYAHAGDHALYLNGLTSTDGTGVTASLLDSSINTGDAFHDSYTLVQNLTGSAYADTLYGNAGANILDGGAGNDLLYGGGGADTLIGGASTQSGSGATLAGGDTASYDTSGAGVVASLTTYFPYGASVLETHDAFGDSFSLVENLTGTAVDDTLIGNDGLNILNGGGGDDILEGMDGGDRIIGGGHSINGDTASYAHANGITASLTSLADPSNLDLLLYQDTTNNIATLTISGDAVGDAYENIQNLLGSDYSDTLVGDYNSNTLSGGLSDDTLEGLGGADILNGGDGSDTASYDHANLGVVASLTTSFTQGSTVIPTNDAAGDTYINIENLIGSHLDDVLIGNSGDNIIKGGAGNDILEGMGGSDTLNGGTGTDTASYEHATSQVKVSLTDLAVAGPYQDLTFASEGHAAGDTFNSIENLTGSNFNDTLIGNTSSNVLSGGGGDDLLEGIGSHDTYDGGGGNNTVSYAHALISGGLGVTASLTTNAGTAGDATGDTYTNIQNLTGSAFDDILTGDTGANILTGGDGNDTLNGGVNIVGSAGDTMYGGNGNDSLTSNGVGANKLYGDAGDDIFTLTGDDANVDTIDGGANAASGFGRGVGGASIGDTIIWNASIYNRIDVDMSTHIIYVRSPVTGNDVTFSNIENFTVLGNNSIYAYLDNYSNIVDATANGVGNIDYVDYRYSLGSVSGALGVISNVTNGYVDGSGNVHNAVFTITDGIGTVTGGSSVMNNYDAATKTWSDASNIGDTLKGIEYLYYGTHYADNLVGDSHNNWLQGGLGADYINGGDGTDTVYLDSWRSQTVVASLLTPSLNVAEGIVMSDTAQGDTYIRIENLYSSGAADILIGNSLANRFDGNGIMEGLAGGDFFNGLGGTNATVSYAHSGDAALVSSGDSAAIVNGVGVTVNLYATVGAFGAGLPVNNSGDAASDTYANIYNLIGSAYNDYLIGNNSNNVITGGAGNDVLEGMGGADQLHGDAGIDTASYAHATSAVLADMGNTGLYTTAGDGAGDTFSGVENIIGSIKDDTLYGDGSDNVMMGGLGNDKLDGAGGFNTASYANATGTVTVSLLSGSASGADGSDTLTNIQGVIGSSSADTISGDHNDNVIDGGLGADTLHGDTGTDTLSYASATSAVSVNMKTGANTQNDVFDNFENLLGSIYGDTLTGDDNSNVIDGGASNISLAGDLGNDILVGGNNTSGIGDTVTYKSALSGVAVSLALTSQQNTVGAGLDTISLFENLTGSDYADTLTGDNAANIISGGSGDDLLYANADPLDASAHTLAVSLTSGDSLIGGGGVDTVSFAHTVAATPQTVSGAAWGAWNGQAGLIGVVAVINGTATHDGVTDTLTSVENIIGSSFNDYIIGDASNNLIEGGSGSDHLAGGGGTDTVTYAHAGTDVVASLGSGTASHDGYSDTLSGFTNIIGSTHNDTLTGDGGDNVLIGGLGNDVINGGAHGSIGDTASYSTATDYVTVSLATTAQQDTHGAGLDTLSNIQNLIGSDYYDNLHSGVGDTLTGNASNNTLDGGLGDDTLIGGGGADILIGGGGTDTASYTTAAAGVTLTLGRTGLTAAQLLAGGDATGDTFNSIENVTGSTYADTLYGSTGNNTINGNGGNDTIYASDGNDIIYANKDHVSAYGENNNDTFYVSTLTANLPTMIDGGNRDPGYVQNHGGNVMIMQDLQSMVAQPSGFNMSNLNNTVLANGPLTTVRYIDTINIHDGVSSQINMSSVDVNNLVNANGTSGSIGAQIWVTADTGDKLNVSLAAGETIGKSSIVSLADGSTYTDYTVYNSGMGTVAQVHWHAV